MKDKKISQKWYYCEKCKTYPDNIYEMYDRMKEIRRWEETTECYGIIDTEHDDCNAYCGICETKLEEK